jgi:hypothetical protein
MALQGVEWSAIPQDLRDLLRWPLASGLYSRIATSGGETPKNEEGLLSAYWIRTQARLRGSDHPQLLERLAAAAAAAVARDFRYPFSTATLVEVGLAQDDHAQLLRTGMLRADDAGALSFWHDRFLSWACATHWAAVLSNCRDDEAVASVLSHLNPTSLFNCSPALLYLPLDLGWMLMQGPRPRPDLLGRIVPSLEDHRFYSEVFEAWLPSLGSAVIPALDARLRTVECDAYPGPPGVGRALARLARGGAPVTATILEWLASASQAHHIAALVSLKETPSADPEILRHLWDRHLRAIVDGDERTDINRHLRAALYACSRLNPDWVCANIAAASGDPVAMYEAASLFRALQSNAARGRWATIARPLLETLGAQQYVAARCIAHVSDSTGCGYLLACLESDNPRVVDAALDGLADLDPDAAIAWLARGIMTAFHPSWTPRWLSVLLYRRPAEFRTFLSNRIARKDPAALDWVLSLQNHSADLDGPLVRGILALLPGLVDKTVASPSSHPHHRLAAVIALLARAWSCEVLPAFAEHAGTDVERSLLALLSYGATQQWSAVDENDALVLLARMSMAGLADGVQRLLGSGTHGSRLHALDWALVIRSISIEECLIESARAPLGVERETSHVVRYRCLDVLVCAGRLDVVVESAMSGPAGLELSIGPLVRTLGPLSPSVQASLLAEIERSDATHRSTAAWLLAWGGTPEAAARLREVCERANWDVALARPAITAQEIAGVEGEAAMAFLMRALDHRDLVLPAGWQLSRIAGDDGRSAVARFLASDEFGRRRASDCLELALDLHQNGWPAADLLVAKYALAAPHVLEMDSRWLAATSRLDDPAVLEKVHELALDPSRSLASGIRPAALRSLAVRNRDVAYAEAQRLFEEEKLSRPLFADALLSIAPERAVSYLLDRAREVADDVELVGDALEAAHVPTTPVAVAAFLDSDNPAERALGCEIAGRIRCEALVARLSRIADTDTDDDARWSAMAALRRHRDQESARELCARLATAETDREALPLLAAIELYADFDMSLVNDEVQAYRASRRGKSIAWARLSSQLCKARPKDSRRTRRKK